jgi:hypothetical protein
MVLEQIGQLCPLQHTHHPHFHEFKDSNFGPAAPAYAECDHRIILQAEDQRSLEYGTNSFLAAEVGGSLHFVLAPELKLELGLDAVELPVVPWLEDKNSYFQKKAHWEEDLHALYRYRDRNP